MSCGPAFSSVFMNSSWLKCLSCGGLYRKTKKKNHENTVTVFSNHPPPAHADGISLPSTVIYIFAKALDLPHNVPREREKKGCLHNQYLRYTVHVYIYLSLVTTERSLLSNGTGWGHTYLPHENMRRSLSNPIFFSQLQNLTSARF